jgi:hypothetical protein
MCWHEQLVGRRRGRGRGRRREEDCVLRSLLFQSPLLSFNS